MSLEALTYEPPELTPERLDEMIATLRLQRINFDQHGTPAPKAAKAKSEISKAADELKVEIKL